MSDREEHGRFYIELKSSRHPTMGVVHYYEVGEITELEGERLYHPSSDFAAKTREEALMWISRRS